MEEMYLPEGSLIGTAENREALSSLSSLERAMQRQQILEGIVTMCDGQMRLHVDLRCAEGIIEPEEAVYLREGEERKDIAIITRVGKPVAFRVLGIENRDGTVTARLSRRAAQKESMEAFLRKRQPGDIIPAKVTHTEPFGAFLDIGCGIPALLSVDCISVSRISHPRDRLTCGMPLSVAVKSIDRVYGRIYVTLRELLGTWSENAMNFHAGETVSGILRSVESYGVFVELAPNLAGLAEVREDAASELRNRIGQSVAVYIKSIVPDRMKIKLVLIDTSSEPAATRLRYYLDPEKRHIDRWVYSPPASPRVVETVFDE